MAGRKRSTAKATAKKATAKKATAKKATAKSPKTKKAATKKPSGGKRSAATQSASRQGPPRRAKAHAKSVIPVALKNSTGAINRVLQTIKDSKVRYIDLRFTDTRGKEQHVSIPADSAEADLFIDGKMFDGSSIAGWKGISESDMVLFPEADTAFLDPFTDDVFLNIRCDVLEPTTMTGYSRDPRSLARRAEEYLKSTGIADTAYMGPEPEFFLFEDVRWSTDLNGCFYLVDSSEGAWNTGTEYKGGNKGFRPSVKGGYFPVPPVDSSLEIRSAMCDILSNLGMVIEAHHHEVATGNQNEIAFRYNTLLKKADEVQVMKYVVQQVAHRFGKSATFMPKPLVGDNGSGMHVHQSLGKKKKNLFAGTMYGGLSQLALHYIGGIIKHARAVNAFTNSTTNSYKRLVPGFEAPTMLAYSNRNRSVSIRLPYVSSANQRRIETRFPDGAGNAYLAFSALLLAGLDGIQNKIDPGEALDKSAYDMTPREAAQIPTVCNTLQQALEELDADRSFLTKGGVFDDDFIDAYIKLKDEEVARLRSTTHPVELDMYYEQ